MKVILNKCFGGFSVSPKAYKLYAKKKGIELYPYIEANSNFILNSSYILEQGTLHNKVDWTNRRFYKVDWTNKRLNMG